MSDDMKAYRRRIEDARFRMDRASADQVELQELRLEVEALEAEVERLERVRNAALAVSNAASAATWDAALQSLRATLEREA
jgi:hypothetical protein